MITNPKKVVGSRTGAAVGKWAIALLLAHGADIDADNGGGMTPIMFASMFGRTNVVGQLRTHGASLARRNRLGISARWMMHLARPINLMFGRKAIRPISVT